MSKDARRWAFVGAAASLLVASSAASPALLRRIDAFTIARVEVTGAHHLGPDRAVEIAGITLGSSIFDDPAPWRAALLANPLVIDVSITRRVPGTIRIHVVETQPVALASLPDLTPVDGRGNVLPVADDVALDLPVLATRSRLGPDGRIADPESMLMLGMLRTIVKHEPWLISWISALEVQNYGDVALTLRWPDARVLLPRDVDAKRLDEVRLAFSDLMNGTGAAASGTGAGSPGTGSGTGAGAGLPGAGPGAGSSGAGPGAGAGVDLTRTDLARLIQLDARYRDQVVVALKPDTRGGGTR